MTDRKLVDCIKALNRAAVKVREDGTGETVKELNNYYKIDIVHYGDLYTDTILYAYTIFIMEKEIIHDTNKA